jgi:hypothetical protein
MSAVEMAGEERDQPLDQVDLRDDRVDIELPSQKEDCRNRFNCGRAGENGGPQFMDVLEEVIQMAWTSETTHESSTKCVLCPVYKKGGKLDCTNYRGICLLNVAYKVFTNLCDFNTSTQKH